MKHLLIIGISLVLLSCSSTNQTSYFGYNNNPKIEDTSNDEIEVYKTGNNIIEESDLERTNNITNYYVLPPGYYNPWDYYPNYDYMRMSYPSFYFYWDNWRFNRWAYYNPYSYWDYGWYNPYRHHHHYYDHYYYNDYYGNNNSTPEPPRKDYRDFGVSRGEFGSPARNVTSSSSSRGSAVTPIGSVRNVNSSGTRTTNSNNYNKPESNNVENPTNNRISNPSNNNRSIQREGRDVNVRQSTPRTETPSRSNERVAPSNSGSNNSPSRSNSESSPSRSSESKSGSSSGQRSR